VETQSEFDTLHGMGIDLMQGYLFAQPSEPFCEVNWAGTHRRSA
jgi:EAL domain-containing protein (putative c-di-GMP-specific phosphodiesterase class I)